MQHFTAGVEFALRAAVEQPEEAVACSMADSAKKELAEHFKVAATTTHSFEADVSGLAAGDYDCIPGPRSSMDRFGSEACGGFTSHCSTSQCNIGFLGLPFRFINCNF